MSEFQVIVLAAGKGSRYREITTRKPKCLLPIGKNPMIYYPIKLFEKAGFKEIFIVVCETAKSEVEFALEQTDLSIKCNVITVPWDDRGSADSLRYLASYIISDPIVVSCDLVSNFDIKSVLDFHRRNDASITGLYFRGSVVSDSNLVTPGPKTKTKKEKDFVGVDPITSRLVFQASASDYEETLKLKHSLLLKHGRVVIFTTLLDAHCYVMKKWLIKYLVQDENLSSVKGELIPHVLKMQRSIKNKLQTGKECLSEEDLIQGSSDIFSLARDLQYESSAQSMSSYNDHHGDMYLAYMNDNIRCYAYISENDWALRCNTLREYCTANNMIAAKWKDIANKSECSNISSESTINSNQVDRSSCFVGANTAIASKTSISSSCFGTGCVVQGKTRILDCILMNNVKIEEGCTLTNCVICDDVIVESNSTLKDCIIGSGYTVPPKSNHSNEIISENDSIMEV